MGKSKTIDYEKILNLISLTVDLPALGEIISKIPEEK